MSTMRWYVIFGWGFLSGIIFGALVTAAAWFAYLINVGDRERP